MFCSHCGKEIMDNAEICIGCGCRVKERTVSISNDRVILVRFLLTFLFGFIGSFVINYSYLKPEGWKSRTCAYFFLSIFTRGIYPLVASICNFSFNPKNDSNIGYYKD